MLAPGKIFVDGVINITATFTDADGIAVNPTTVTFKTMSPCRTETDYVYGTDSEVTRPATGYYIAQIQPGEAGVWFFRWETTGTGTTSAVEGRFNVQISPFFCDFESDYTL